MSDTTDWSFESLESALVLRVAIAGCDAAEAARQLTPAAAEEWRAALDTARRIVASFERKKHDTLNDGALSPSGKAGAVAKLVIDVWDKLAPLRTIATRAAADAAALRARAVRLVPDGVSGFLVESPSPPPPSVEALAVERELRDALATWSAADVRKIYLERVRDVGGDSFTRAVEADPLSTLRRPEVWLDQRTLTAAHDMRIQRAGMGDACRQAEAYARLTQHVVERLAPVLGVQQERPAFIRG